MNELPDFYWLNKDSKTFLSRKYLDEGVTPKKRIKQIAARAEEILGIDGFANKFYNYMARGFYSLSTPVWLNFGKDSGLPVSCFGSYIPDTMNGILRKASEVGIMSKIGGGTSGYFGGLRERGAHIQGGRFSSDGPVRFMELFDRVADLVSQGSARRGSFAAYLPIDHPDIMEFLRIRSDGHPIQTMSFGVNITDDWMRTMIDGDKEKRQVWSSLIKKRFETGYPYIHFVDTANNAAPKEYAHHNLRINNSNLCAEIELSNDEENSFVCVLSSINIARYKEMRETDAVETLIYFLDAVNEEFIQKAEGVEFMESPLNFAKSQRALGLGVLGWHTFLQSENIPFESMEAKMLNAEIFQTIRERCDSATKSLASILGEPELLKGSGRRNMTVMAVAPTTSSSFILGQVSQSIEPLNSNYFVKNLAKGTFTYKNPILSEVLASYSKNDAATWRSILTHGGSVQHLDFLSDHEKDVFKTFGEISQKEIVIQASQRQKYIDQGQSLNVMIPPSTHPKEVSDLLIFGWEQGIKSFYYQRSANPSQELSRSIMNCASCEG